MKRYAICVSLSSVFAALFLSLGVMATSGKTAPGNDIKGVKPAAFVVCAACHRTDQKATNGIGPNLFAIGGTKAGKSAGFNYSPAMKASVVVWNRANLIDFMTAPKNFIPGNRMPYAGIKNRQDAEAIADYLLSVK